MSAASAADIAEAMGVPKSTVIRRAQTEGWLYTEEPGRPKHPNPERDMTPEPLSASNIEFPAPPRPNLGPQTGRGLFPPPKRIQGPSWPKDSFRQFKAAIEARWEAASSKRWIADLRYATRVVTLRGVRFRGLWISSPVLMGHIGEQVVIRGDGRGNLIVFCGALLKRMAVLRPMAVLRNEP